NVRFLIDSTGAGIFNPSLNDSDFIVRGDNDSNLFYTDASTDRVGIGTNTPGYKLHVKKDSATAEVRVESDTSANISLQKTGTGAEVWSLSAASDGFRLTQGATTRLFYTGGKLSVSTSNLGYDLGVSGTLGATGSATIEGGTITAGTTSQSGLLVVHDGSGETATLQTNNLTNSGIYRLPQLNGDYDDTFCFFDLNNCPGSGVTSLNSLTGALNITSASANEITVSPSGSNIEIGLPDSVTITSNLSVTNKLKYVDADYSMYFGTGSGASLSSSPQNNTAFGYNALNALTSGDNNVAIGTSSGIAINTAADNTAVGHQSLFSNTSGSRNVAIGKQALYQATNNDNIGVGEQALYNLQGGSNNIGIGGATGATNLASGSYNILIGYGADVTALDDSYYLNIANFLYGSIASGDLTIAGNDASDTPSITIGTTTQDGSLVIHDGGGNTGTLSTNGALGGNFSYYLPAETGTICTTGSVCSGYQASGSYFVQGGNDFGGTGTLGLTSNNDLNVITNSLTRLTVQNDGDVAFDTDTLFVDASANKVSVGDATPSGNGTKLVVTENATEAFSDFDSMAYFSRDVTPSASGTTDSYLSAWYRLFVKNSANSIEQVVGQNDQIIHEGTQSVTDAYGNQGTITLENTGDITNGYAFVSTFQLVDNAGSNIQNGVGFYASTPSATVGSITNMYGLQVKNQANTYVTTAYGGLIEAQTGAISASYGLAIQAATTQTLWLSQNADNTTASAGIAFGSSRDTNLYRSAANTLRTDDSLVVNANLTVDTDTLYVDSSGDKVGIGTVSPDEKLHVEGNIMIGARSDNTGSSTYASLSFPSGEDAISASTVFNGKLYVGTKDSNDAAIYRFDGGTTWTRVSDSTEGKIVSADGDQIDEITSLVVFDGKLFAAADTGTDNTGAVYSYDGSSWTLVNATRGTFGSETNRDGAGSMAVYNGILYVTTIETDAAAVYRYVGGSTFKLTPGQTAVGKFDNGTGGDIPGVADNDKLHLIVYGDRLMVGTETGSTGDDAALAYFGGTDWFTTQGSDEGQFIGGASSTIDNVTSLAVYNGALYLTTEEGTNSTEIIRYNGSPMSGNADPDSADTFTKVSNASVGKIDSASAGQYIDKAYLNVYNGELYASSDTGSDGKAAVFRYSQDTLTWTKIAEAEGTFNSTANIDSATMLIEYNDTLYVGAGDANSAGMYTFNRNVDMSYALKFVSHSDGTFDNIGTFEFIGVQDGQNNAHNSGQFLLSHSIATSAGAYDIAEDYFTREAELNKGDVVAIDPDETIAGFVRRADLSKGDNTRLLGIVSTNPALRLSQKQTTNAEEGYRTVPIALAGRVPVKMDPNSEEIRPGDMLTASDLVGHAKKLTGDGVVIAKALEGWSVDSGKQTAEVYITNGYFGNGILHTESGENTQAEQDQNAVIEGLSWFKDTFFAVVDNTLHVLKNIVFFGKAIFKSDVEFEDRVTYHDKDYAGQARIKAGQTEIRVQFEKPYQETPVVNITPYNYGKFVVTNRDSQGFTIVIESPQAEDVEFGWMAIPVKDAKTHETIVQINE
ncbi:hypothetical protein DYH10_04295, partial [Candidatus Saccharibacteria bacterium CPR2]|nr:hypothetical protein [Candidatus Saccharibacteria bacterium CPR2]